MFRSIAFGAGAYILALSALSPSPHSQVPIDKSRVPSDSVSVLWTRTTEATVRGAQSKPQRYDTK